VTEPERLDPRAQRTRAAALDAARVLLATEGRDAVTPSRVAEVSGVGRATVYRHWPEPLALLVEAATPPPAPDVPAPSGDLAVDLTARLDALRRGLEGAPLAAVFSMLIEQAEHQTELERLQQDLVESGSAPLRALLRDAVRRGVLPRLDEERAVETLVAPLFYRRFVSRRPIPARLTAKLVADFLAHPPVR
jgi:AcrR family transcriptional regulator